MTKRPKRLDGLKITHLRFRLSASAVRKINRIREWEERSAKANLHLRFGQREYPQQKPKTSG